jgi:hypothetical protein
MYNVHPTFISPLKGEEIKEGLIHPLWVGNEKELILASRGRI